MSTQQLSYEDVQVGDALPALVKTPTTRQLVKYAGASGDYYEIHYDHHFALKAGLHDGVIVHGLLTAGWLAQLLTDWLPSPLALKKFSVSYRSMARPGDIITCTGTIVSKYEKDGQHLIDCDVAAENQWGEKCAIGNATVALPRRSSGDFRQRTSLVHHGTPSPSGGEAGRGESRGRGDKRAHRPRCAPLQPPPAGGRQWVEYFPEIA